MKKLMANKKIFMGVIAVMIGVSVLATALSYAWWNISNTGDGVNVISLGKMDIDLKLDEDAFFFMGGDLVDDSYGEGSIKNTGTVNAFVKINFTADTIFMSGDEIPNDDIVNVYLEYRDYDFSGNTLSNDQWYFYDKGDGTFDYFVLLMPSEEFAFFYKVRFDGDKMGNEYMEATIEIKSEYTATQFHESAIKAELGVDLNDLVKFNDSQRDDSGDDNFYPFSIGIEDLLS